MDAITKDLIETLKAVRCTLEAIEYNASKTGNRGTRNLAIESMEWIDSSLVKAGFVVENGRLVKTSGEIGE